MNGLVWTSRFEGRKNTAYWDPIGKCWTIGIGHTGAEVHEGLIWTSLETSAAFSRDYGKAATEAQEAVGAAWTKLDETRRTVLIDLAFELGLAGEEKFGTFLGLVREGKFEAAADDLAQTLLAHEVPSRVAANCKLLRTGSWPL